MLHKIMIVALLSIVPAGAVQDRSPLHAAAGEASDEVVLTRSDVLTIQGVLNLYGFDAGREDGVLGPRTRAALRRFQRDMGLPATGEVTPETWKLIQEAP